MKLIGNYFSPFVRRVAISLHALDLPFELEEVSVANEPERVRVHNPLIRIPTLLLDDGVVLVESAAILDEIDQMVGPEKRLVPPSGLVRRNVVQITAMALASMEKAQWAFYEKRFRTEDKVHQPWIDHNDSQAVGGLKFLNDVVIAAGDSWIAKTPRMTQADITVAVVCNSIHTIRPNINVRHIVPDLFRFAERCEELGCFRRAAAPAAPPSYKK